MSLLPIQPPEFEPVRRCVVPFPAYRFVPGLHPHPRLHASGHSYGKDAVPPSCAWPLALDLFDARYFWEAHEAWEVLWAMTHPETPAHLGLKGLINLAAAMLKLHMGAREASRGLASRAIGWLEVVEPRRLFDLCLPAVAEEARNRLLRDPTTLESAIFHLSSLERKCPDSSGGRSAARTRANIEIPCEPAPDPVYTSSPSLVHPYAPHRGGENAPR